MPKTHYRLTLKVLVTLAVLFIVFIAVSSTAASETKTSKSQDEDVVSSSIQTDTQIPYNVTSEVTSTPESEAPKCNATDVVLTDVVLDDSRFIYLTDIPLDEDWQRYVWNLCAENGVSPFLVYGLIEKESQFQAQAIGSGRDYGLMQIRDSNHRWINKQVGYKLDYLDAYDNVLAGITWLNYVAGECGGYDDLSYVLMVYNQGPPGMLKHEQGVESSSYSRKVLEYMNEWQECYTTAIKADDERIMAAIKETITTS